VDVIISWMASNSGPRLLRQWYLHQANQPESTTIGKGRCLKNLQRWGILKLFYCTFDMSPGMSNQKWITGNGRNVFYFLLYLSLTK
jgi:hypothetical protein